MGRSTEKLRVAATLLMCLAPVNGQDPLTEAGPAWNHADYETSPPVYPSPQMSGAGWEIALEKAKAWVSQLTTDEKSLLVTGTEGPCVGNIAPIPRLNFTGLCLQDGPLSLRQADYASVFPAGISVAAAWDRKLAYKRGYQLGAEYKAKGAHVVLGPVAGPLGRSGYAGRNWEGFSPEPYLTGIFMSETIEGHQDAGVQACAKHYVGNEQETQRNPSINPETNQTIEALSANIDDRTLHELYNWPFANAVKSGVASVMCSYQRLNGSYGCQNSKILNGVLKEEMGFQGWVVSDWMATHAGHQAADAGLDMNMPGGLVFSQSVPSFWGKNLTTSVENGSLALTRLDDMAHRVMAPYFHLNQDVNFPNVDGSSPGLQKTWTQSTYRYNFTYGPKSTDVRANHKELIRELGAAGTVLLKNVNKTLPLKNPKNIAVYGNDAGDITNGLYFANLISNTGFEYGVLPTAGGSGTGRFTYVVPPLDAIKAKVDEDALVQYLLNNTQIIGGQQQGPTGFVGLTPDSSGLIYPEPEVCLVFVKTWASEGYDRTTLRFDWNGTEVVETVALSCPNTIVITHSSGLNVLPFADNENVTAIIAAHLPGQEVGNSIVDILWGDVNPSGKLPYTIAHEEEDYAFADITNSTELLETTDPNAWQQDFTERLLIDYRHFDYENKSVAYEFGFGLSYTTFEVADASVEKVVDGEIAPTAAPAAIVPGGNPGLWETLYKITVKVTNTGDLAGATIPQLYLGLPQIKNEATTPPKVLRGFEKVYLEPGQSQEVEFELQRRDISYWDVVAQDWVIDPATINVHVGLSSRDIHTTSSFEPLGPTAYRPRRM
ncbi:unnamed protein product [Zymoseptoria tritici ST99CH_3D1]|uniref:Probable beta-glucosidase G n=2 Tax=Zymoseptoria tritici TaxID=1047171 RepID=A0A1X7RP60_ZYMT9|nr:unnamed protein product [Zymoseptoria tritici ST99CH_3D7]SMR49019.1 unnamed protein product [Zymoseptoria tritici ST99CH_1E4]SMR50196.1 unnamed protein product [Zymoseptoria tritici ST99CH_3D1]